MARGLSTKGEKNHFEEFLWHNHPVFPYFLYRILYNGAADDNDGTVGYGPVAYLFFEVFPFPPVQFGVLRAHVAEVKRLLHGRYAPFHIGSRGHVPLVVARAGVICIGGDDPLHLWVGNEAVGSLDVTLRFLAGKFVSYPVGQSQVFIIRYGISGVTDDLSLSGGSHYRDFQFLGCGDFLLLGD